MPDDDEYDTEDSFIDDAELVIATFSSAILYSCALLLSPPLMLCVLLALLAMQDDYFQVDNSSIKHDGFFVNRGKLERV